MASINPMAELNFTPILSVSSKTYHIAGILTTVYGLDQLPASCDSVSCLWLLHPRLGSKEGMESTAIRSVSSWNVRRSPTSKKGLVAVSFDQRNHGTRQVDKLANEAWKSGNPRHAQDMFSVFHGTAMDTSLLMDHLGSYIFPGRGQRPIDQHFVLGVSLGGHAAWQVLFNEPRVTAGVVIIGCPDYMRVMTDRARLSKLKTYTATGGKDFIGSEDFPTALVESVKKWDPRGLLFGLDEVSLDLSSSDESRLRSLLDSRIKGKSILVCSGGADKLVPYHAAAPFMSFLKAATSGWYSDGKVYVEDNVYDGIGHAFSEEMANDTDTFLGDLLEGQDLSRRRRRSRM